MKKILLLFVCFFPIGVNALDMPEINSEAAIVYDVNEDTVILEKNSDEVRSIASLTKIMTVLTAIENIDDFNASVTITNEMLAGIYWNASVAGLKPGDTVTYMDLLYAAILPSGADATQVLAYAVSGSVDAFVAKMNELALRIGVTNTHYVNTTGLDQNGAYSTAHDQLFILSYALKNPIFRTVYTTKNYTLSNGLQVEATISKYNEILNLDTSKIIGSKTGNTTNAGLCMSALFYHENHEIILITLGAEVVEDVPYNLIDTLTLIDNVNESYVIPKEKTVTTASIVSSDVVVSSNINYNTIIFLIILFLLVTVFLFRRVRRRKRK